MRDHLAPLLAEIADVAGLEAALKIAEARGGTIVNIPAGKRKQNWLIDCVGPEAAEKIIQHFTSGYTRLQLDIPLPPTNSYSQFMRQRRTVIERAVAETNSVQKAALMAGTHRRAIQRHNARKRSGKSSGQGDLF